MSESRRGEGERKKKRKEREMKEEGKRMNSLYECVLLTSLHDSEMFAELVTTCGVCTKLNEILLDNLCKNNSMKPLKLNVLTCRDTVHKHV